ncbi:MAG: hypothetical protein KIT31_19565 [Deltaproteobacteria bacterium]|nr:hypothetical protein [Deltaproteobacteria bacterium]
MKRCLAAFAVLAACGGAKPNLVEREPPPDPPAVVASATTWDKLEGQISEVAVAGPGAADAAVRGEVETLLRAELGHTVDRPRLRDALASVMKVRGVASVAARGEQIAAGRLRLIADVELHPTVTAVSAAQKDGGPIPYRTDLSGADQPLDPTHLDHVAEQLREHYRTDGYRNVEVTWEARASGGAPGVAVRIEVVPGEQLSIAAVDVKGAAGVKRDELLKLLGKTLVAGQPVRDDAIDRAAIELMQLYWDRGYANVRVTPPVLPSGDKKATLAFVVEEGALFRLGKITVAGPSLAPGEVTALQKVAGVKTGDVFNRSAIVAARDRLAEKVTESGRPTPSVAPITNLDLQKRTIDITFEVSVAPRSP